MSQVDLYASIAKLAGHTLTADEAIDSEEHLAAWLNAEVSGRTKAFAGILHLSLRDTQWKYIAPTDRSAAWVDNDKGIESGLSPSPQLYNLDRDIGEKTNLAPDLPEKVSHYQQQLDMIVTRTRRP